MRDIVAIRDGEDLTIVDTVTAKAGNVISTQLGSLEYAPEFGVDLSFFLSSEFQFQNESFKNYLIERLVQQQVNVTQVLDLVSDFTESFSFSVGDADRVEGMIR